MVITIKIVIIIFVIMTMIDMLTIIKIVIVTFVIMTIIVIMKKLKKHDNT